MQKDYNRGLMATLYGKEYSLDESAEFKAVGQFIEDLDWFEKKKRTILESFTSSDIQDDIFVLAHRDELI